MIFDWFTIYAVFSCSPNKTRRKKEYLERGNDLRLVVSACENNNVQLFVSWQLSQILFLVRWKWVSVKASRVKPGLHFEQTSPTFPICYDEIEARSPVNLYARDSEALNKAFHETSTLGFLSLAVSCRFKPMDIFHFTKHTWK